MTRMEALAQADARVCNTFDQALKMHWLDEAEDWIRLTNPQCPGSGGIDQTLFLPSPWDEFYVLYLLLHIHIYHGDMELFNQVRVQLISLCEEYEAFLLRTQLRERKSTVYF